MYGDSSNYEVNPSMQQCPDEGAKKEKVFYETREIVYRHYIQDGGERIMLAEPLIVRHCQMMTDKASSAYVVNDLLHKLYKAILERMDN